MVLPLLCSSLHKNEAEWCKLSYDSSKNAEHFTSSAKHELHNQYSVSIQITLRLLLLIVKSSPRVSCIYIFPFIKECYAIPGNNEHSNTGMTDLSLEMCHYKTKRDFQL